MAKSNLSAGSRKASNQNGWEPPYDDFPLSFHPPSGRLYKKILGRRFYFGYASDWQAAIDKYEQEREARYAGREPRPTGDGLTIKDLCNRFLTSKQNSLDAGEITNRTFKDYKSTTDRIVSLFDKNRLVDDLASDDFERLRADIAKTRGPVALGNEVQRIRVVFKYAYDAGLIDKPVRYGPTFKRPSKKVLRKERNKNGKRMFEAADVLRILGGASAHLKAMVLLGVNCGFGNSDCGSLPIESVDLESGWIVFPRPKTGIDRRCPLWPETVEALKAAIEARSELTDESDVDLVFVTKYGRSWAKESSTNPVSAEFRKLLQGIDEKDATKAKKDKAEPPAKLYRKGCGFYALRHSFRTIADETRDFPAIDLIMGHSADNSMADRYRERIGDDRLRAVVDHVHDWLYGTPESEAGGDDSQAAEVNAAKPVEGDAPRLRVVG